MSLRLVRLQHWHPVWCAGAAAALHAASPLPEVLWGVADLSVADAS